MNDACAMRLPGRLSLVASRGSRRSRSRGCAFRGMPMTCTPSSGSRRSSGDAPTVRRSAERNSEAYDLPAQAAIPHSSSELPSRAISPAMTARNSVRRRASSSGQGIRTTAATTSDSQAESARQPAAGEKTSRSRSLRPSHEASTEMRRSRMISSCKRRVSSASHPAT